MAQFYGEDRKLIVIPAPNQCEACQINGFDHSFHTTTTTEQNRK